MWDNHCRKANERDREFEERRRQRIEEERLKKLDADAKKFFVQEETKPTQKKEQPQQNVQQPTMLDFFNQNLGHYYRDKTAKKFNFPPNVIEEALTNTYKKECVQRMITPQLDSYTTNAISSVARWLSAESHTKGSLLLRGYAGVGKTTMLRAIKALFNGFGLGSKIMVKSAFDINDNVKDKEVFDKIKQVEFLLIDDLGQEHATIKDWGNERNPFEELISARYESLGQTIISTNLVVVDGRDQIEERYGLRVADRLREMCNTINYDPKQPSYRK